MGAHTNVHDMTARKFPMRRPSMQIAELDAMKKEKTPMTNSVAATCSPANSPAK